MNMVPQHLQDALAQAATEGPDMNEASSGGDFERVLPNEGLVRLRFIEYIELGKRNDEYQGQAKVVDDVRLTFELSGPKHPPIELQNGEKLAQTTSISLNKSLSEKAHFYKLFKRMNHTGDCKLFAQLLGRDFLGTFHHVTKGEGDDKKTYANLRDANGYTIRPAFVDDAETGEPKRVTVAEPTLPIKCFLWDYATKEMWDALFIDGKWDDKKDDAGKVTKEGKSKNWVQNRIKEATNFEGSPAAELAFASADVDTGEAEKPERAEEEKQAAVEKDAGASTAEDDDPLAGV